MTESNNGIAESKELRNSVLPAEAYYCPRWFALEQQHIFSRHWLCAGFTEDLTKPGDFLTVQAGGDNLLVVLDNEHQLQAFHNICRHRGTRLKEGSGHCGRAITCPYHDWTWDLAGNLKGIPSKRDEFPVTNLADWPLKKASVAIWRGMIWVNPQPDAGDIQQWFEPIEPWLGPHDPQALVESADDLYDNVIQANWKIVVENYIDHYHLAHLHAGTLNMYDHKQAVYGFHGAHFGFFEPLEAGYASKLSEASPLPLISAVDKDSPGAWVPMLFPGIGLAESESSWSVFVIIPLSPTSSRVIVRTKVEPASNWQYMMQMARSSSFWYRRVRPKSTQLEASHPLGTADFMQEDVYICEQLQKSVTSSHFEPGPSAQNSEAPVRQHQQLIRSLIYPHWSANTRSG